MKPRFLAYLNYVMLVAFLLSVAVQFNDPDPWIWMGMYGFAVLVCLLAALGRLHWSVPLSVAGITLVWGIGVATQAEGVSWIDLTSTLSMKTLEVEQAREAGGLLVVATWMLVLSFAVRRGGKGTSA